MAHARDIYPTMIIFTRYGGVYEGGRWAALDCSHGDVPAAAIGSDVECAEFWALVGAGRYEISDWRARAEPPPPEREGSSSQYRRTLTVGGDSTPDAALASMLVRRP